MKIEMVRTNVMVTDVCFNKIDALAKACGVSRNRLFECLAELDVANTKKIVAKASPVIDARYEAKNKEVLESRRAERAKKNATIKKLRGLSQEELEILLDKAG